MGWHRRGKVHVPFLEVMAHPSQQLHVPATSISTHGPEAEIDIFRELTKAVARAPDTVEGMSSIMDAARSIARNHTMPLDHIPIATIIFATRLGQAAHDAMTVEQVTGVELPMLREARENGFRLVLVGGPIATFGEEVRADYRATLFNRAAVLAFGRPQQITFSEAFFHRSTEKALEATYHQDPEQSFLPHHIRELTSGGVRVFMPTGPWGRSSVTIQQVRVAERHGVIVKDMAGNEALRDFAVGAAQQAGH